MSKTIEINGVTFTVFRSGCTHKIFECGGRDLYNVYKKPSRNKLAIYAGWLNWYTYADGVRNFGVDRGNCYAFTLSGIYKDSNGKEYGLHITPSNNYAYELND